MGHFGHQIAHSHKINWARRPNISPLPVTLIIIFIVQHNNNLKTKKQNKNKNYCGLSCDRIETTWKRKGSDQLLHRHTEIATLVFTILKNKQKYNRRVLINFHITHFFPFSLGFLFRQFLSVTVSLFLCLCLFFKSQTSSNNTLSLLGFFIFIVVVVSGFLAIWWPNNMDLVSGYKVTSISLSL